MIESELITRAYELLAQGRVEAAEGYFERYMGGRGRFAGAEVLREAWRKDVAERRRQLAGCERAREQEVGRWR